MVSHAVPAKRLSSFYFWYYSLLGISHPFWPIFLAANEFDAKEIGQLLAILMGTRILSPNLWGWLADRTGKRIETIRWGSFLASLCFIGIFFADSFWQMAMVMAAYSFFWNAVIPQFETLTVEHLHHEPHRYSSIRVWGSVGFILAVLAGGAWFENQIGSFGWVVLFFLALIWGSSLIVPATGKHEHTKNQSGLGQVIRQPAVLGFLAMSFLLQVAHGIYYSFFSLGLEAQGYSRGSIGLFWAISVVAEIVLFAFMRRILTNWTLWGILVCCLGLTILRWLLIGHYSASLTVLLLAQSLHAFSFGGCHVVSIEYLRRYFPPQHRGQAQAIYSASTFGAGGALGALLGGLCWQFGPTMTFDIAALISLFALLIAWFYMKESVPTHRITETP